MIASDTVGIACPTLSVPGMSSSLTMRPRTRTAVVVAKEPIPNVSKKSVTVPRPSRMGMGMRRGSLAGASIDTPDLVGTALLREESRSRQPAVNVSRGAGSTTCRALRPCQECSVP